MFVSVVSEHFFLVSKSSLSENMQDLIRNKHNSRMTTNIETAPDFLWS